MVCSEDCVTGMMAERGRRIRSGGGGWVKCDLHQHGDWAELRAEASGEERFPGVRPAHALSRTGGGGAGCCVSEKPV